MINFTGKYITSANVFKLKNNGTYKNISASVVEISPESKSDLKFLENTKNLWEKTYNYETIASKIFRVAEQLSENESPTNSRTKFYTLTTQKDSFEKLDEEKALALAEICLISNNLLELDFCQVQPNSEFYKKNRNFKYLGKAVIDFLKEEFKKYTIILSSLEHAKAFYKSQGFQSISPDNTRWMLER